MLISKEEFVKLVEIIKQASVKYEIKSGGGQFTFPLHAQALLNEAEKIIVLNRYCHNNNNFRCNSLCDAFIARFFSAKKSSAKFYCKADQSRLLLHIDQEQVEETTLKPSGEGDR